MELPTEKKEGHSQRKGPRTSKREATDLPVADDPSHGCADLGGRAHYVNAGRGHRLHLVCRGALAAGDDGAGVAHAPSFGGGLAGDERGDRR